MIRLVEPGSLPAPRPRERMDVDLAVSVDRQRVQNDEVGGHRGFGDGSREPAPERADGRPASGSRHHVRRDANVAALVLRS